MTKAGHNIRAASAALWLALLPAVMTPLAAAGQPPQAVARYWKDADTGLAIGGFDPVAYFVDHRPVPGSYKHEAQWGGAVWRFASAANKAVFLEAPDIYAPQFGGYSAIGLARGHPSQGNPTIWTIHANRLYLFFSPAHKLAWSHDPQQWLQQASANWPAISRRIPE